MEICFSELLGLFDAIKFNFKILLFYEMVEIPQKKYIKKLAIVKVKKFLELDMMRTLVLICFFYNSLKIFPIYKIEFTIKFMIF